MRDSGMRDIIVIAGVLFAIFMAGFFFWSNSSLGDNSQETATSASSSKQETAAPVSCTTLDEDDGDGFDECKAKLKDGRTVTCLAMRGGLSCVGRTPRQEKKSDKPVVMVAGSMRVST